MPPPARRRLDTARTSEPLRHLVLVKGDQTDVAWMAEVGHEATQVWSGKPRIALFLAAMRRFRDQLRARGWTVHYRALGKHDAASLRDSLRHTLDLGYGHHIERLMVLGLFALLLGVRPRQVHAWFLAVCVDAVEWVELPNVLGMVLHADGGRMVSKPYAASGKYIQRMSNHCSSCRFRPDEATGEAACPFTTLYWDFLVRHRERFQRHPRAALQWSHLGRRPAGELEAVQAQAAAFRAELAADSRPQHGGDG